MSERSFLCSLNYSSPLGLGSEEPIETHLAFEPLYDNLPLLWVALFDTADIQILHTKEHFLNEDEIEDYECGPAKPLDLPVLFTSTTSAQENLKSRLPLIRSRTHKKLRGFVDAFAEGVGSIQDSHIQIDTHAIWSEYCEENTEELTQLLTHRIGTFESEEAWEKAFGKKVVISTLPLYGLPFFLPPFGGLVYLPWCWVNPDGNLMEKEF